MKEILENEVLSDDQLENISGGTPEQTSEDYSFLENFGYAPKRTFWKNTNQTYFYKETQVKKGWDKVGITYEAGLNDDNKYFLGGEEISRKNAFKHLLNQRGWNQIAIDCFDYDNYGF